VSAELILRHCGAISASIELLRVQVLALEAYAKTLQAPQTARVELPAQCAGKTDEQCGLQNDDAWIDRRTLADPKRRSCRGCGYVEGT
jgi:hypothetical protein